MSAQYDLNLQDYLRILRRRWKIVAGSCLAVGVLTLLLTPHVASVYEATARVKWSRTDSITGLFLEAFTWSPGDEIVLTTGQRGIHADRHRERIMRARLPSRAGR